MRPKYRIWDKQEKKWYTPTYRAYNGDLEDLSLGPGGDLYMRKMVVGTDKWIHESMFPDRFEIVMFTGLKDRNSKEIYEGDIIRVGDMPIYDAEVSYSEEAGAWMLFRDKQMPCLVNACFDYDRVVIGNIYEHPHLLERSQS